MATIHRLDLRGRLLVLFALTLLPALALLLHSGYQQRRNAVESVRVTSLRTLRLAAHQQEDAIEGTRQLLSGLAQLGVVHRHDAIACSAILADILRRSPLYTNIVAATPDGEVFCSGVHVGRAVNLADRPWFQQVLKTGHFVIGGYAVGRIAGKRSFAVAYPALSEAGVLQAVVLAELDLKKLGQLTDEAILPPGSVLLVLDVNGVILARHPDPEQWVGKSVAGTPLGSTILARGGEGTAEATFLDGVERVFAFTPIAGNEQAGRVRMVLGIPRDVAFAAVNRALARALTVVTIIAFVAFTLIWVAGDRLVRRPFSALARVVRRFGEGDLSARCGLTDQGGEMGALARAFDGMAEALQDRERRLRIAERAAVESRYAWILEGTADAIIAVDAAQRIVLFNRGAEEIFGYATREVLGQPLDLLIPAWAVEAHRRHISEFFAGRGQARRLGERGEVTGRRRDGVEFPAEISISRQTREGETLVMAILRDISERRVAEAALRNITEGVAGATGETFFRLLTKHLSTAVGADHVLVGELHEGEDEKVETLAVCSNDEIGGNFTYDLRGTPCARVATKSLCFHPRGVRDEFPDDRLLARWGVEAFMGVPLLGSTGKPLGLLVVAHRAPFRNEQLVEALLRIFALRAAAELERERTERALRASERSLHAIVETAPSLIVLTDPEGRIVLFNRTCEELTGYDRDEVLGRMIFDLFLRPESVPVAQQCFSDSGVSGIRTPHDIAWLTKSGEERLIEWRCRVMPWSKDNPRGMLAVGLDMTGQRRTEEQLRQSQRMDAVGRLAGGIAHDFNNLLTVIIGRTLLLPNHVALTDAAARDLDLIRKTAARAAGLTKQLLAFSRRQILQPRVLDLNMLVENMTAMLSRLIPENIELVFRAGTDLGRVKADPGQLEQVILNLVVNARDAMPDGGHLTLETADVELDETYALSHAGSVPGRYVLLALSDTGSGIPPAVLPRIFEPFFTTKESGKGTGLGLATVYGIVQQSNGNISVYSEVGHGTTFKIYLPRVEEAPVPVREGKPVVGSPRGTETILLVEDDEELRSLAREILEAHGYTVLAAANPGEAMPVAEQHTGTIHLVLTDVIMPGMNGRELTQRLVEARPEVKVLYASGYTDDAIAHRGVFGPGMAFLPKPFSPDALVRKVREVLDAS